MSESSTYILRKVRNTTTLLKTALCLVVCGALVVAACLTTLAGM